MFLRSSFPPQRSGVNRIEAVVVANLLLLTVLLLLPACVSRIQPAHSRTQSTNNLKQIGLAMQSFHDGAKRIPFNGTRAAVGEDPASGSWLFQILPYIDQQLMFHLGGAAEGAAFPPQFLTIGIAGYVDPARGRQLYEDGKGAWSDYFINNYLNDPAHADTPNNPDQKRTVVEITDGTSNTIFAGHGNIATGDYAKTKDVAGSSNIFAGGTQGTMRGGPKWVKRSRPKVMQQRDAAMPAVLAIGGWGGPYPQGGLMVWCDGTVRMVSYATPADVFGAYLTPTGNEDVALPD